MDIQNRRAIKETAARALASAHGAPRQIPLVYAAVSCLLSLAATVISFVLSSQIAETGGLSNLGLRSILSTIRYILPFVQVLVLMGMDMGYHRAVLRLARNREAAPRTLLEGFSLFGPMLRTMILLCCMCFAIIMGSLYLSSYIFMFLPAYEQFYAAMEPVLESMTAMSSTMVIDDATLAAAATAMEPMMWIFAAVCCALLIPIFYQYRMVLFCLADSSRPGALAALRESRTMMRRNRVALFKLDLGFWWYYLLQMLVTVVCYGDILLPMAGVTLPWSETVSYFLFFILSLVMQTAVYYFFMNRVHVTYAVAYEALRPKPQEKGVPLGNIFDM